MDLAENVRLLSYNQMDEVQYSGDICKVEQKHKRMF
jgi:hypothetical protein